MAADAPTSTSPNELEKAKDNSHEVDPLQGLTSSTVSTTSHTPSEQPDSERPPQHNLPDPQVAALRIIFPDYDDGLLLSVLQSVGGNQDRAIDALLGMSDPQYKSEAPTASEQSGQAPSQVDLDEQLARRLMLEEGQEHAVPYRPYNGSARRGHRPPPPREGPPEKDTYSEFQDHISRFAGAGKKTFEGIFSRVKAKIQEYDKPSKAPEAPHPPSWGAGPAPRPPSQRWSYSSGSQEQQPYHDPSPPVAAISSSSSAPAGKPVQPYDIGSEQDAGTSEPPRTEPATDIASPRTSMGSRPVTTIDGGKLGLLPKRPVSLLKPQVAAGGQTVVERQTSVDDDDDELEYTENPFEDHRS
ncbi:hypothetical protein AX14_008361 [Amanita brunnescens Koide BX004]|nr:hypothetical protein AX14_008361 [Amanita brunnescens Koide BX004]